MVWMLLPVFLVLLPFPAVGQRQRESYGDLEWREEDEWRRGRISVLAPWDVYEQSTLEGASLDVVYDMRKMCEEEFGLPSASQDGGKVPLRVDFMRFCVDSRGRLLMLVLSASRKAETENEEARMQRLFRKLKKVRFPPFDRRDIPKVKRDSMYFCRSMPCLKHVPREKTEW